MIEKGNFAANSNRALVTFPMKCLPQQWSQVSILGFLLAVSSDSIHSVEKWRSKGVNCLQNFGCRKKRLCFWESVLSFNKFIGYENLMDCPQIWPEDSLGINMKTVWGIYIFQNWSPTVAFIVTCVTKFLVNKLNLIEKLQNNQWEYGKSLTWFWWLMPCE